MSGFGTQPSLLSSGDSHKPLKSHRKRLSLELCQEGSGVLGSPALSSPSGKWAWCTEKKDMIGHGM